MNEQHIIEVIQYSSLGNMIVTAIWGWTILRRLDRLEAKDAKGETDASNRN